MRFEIEVTAEDIVNGDSQSPCDCPVAIAIARATGLNRGQGFFDVDSDGLYVQGLRGLRRASNRLPRSAREFIRALDDHEEVAPFKFKLGIFNWCLPTEAHKEA